MPSWTTSNRQISQLKSDALQMNDLMQSEKLSLQRSEAMFTDGLSCSHARSAELSKVDGVAASSAAPKLIPGFTILWHSALLPVGAVVRRALLLSLIISCTLWAMMLMGMIAKPIVYKRFLVPTVGSPVDSPLSPVDMEGTSADL